MNPNNGVTTPPKRQYSIKVKVLYKIKAIQRRKKIKKIKTAFVTVCVYCFEFVSISQKVAEMHSKCNLVDSREYPQVDTA